MSFLPSPVARKAVLGLAVVASTTVLLAGCGRSAPAAPAASADPIDDGPASGTVQLWAPDGDAKALDEVLAPFEEANPDLDVEITLIPSSDYNTKLQAALASGTGPDIAQVYTEAQTQFTGGGDFAPVPDGLVDPSAFFPGSWEAGVVDGTAYSVPWYAYTYALVYRADLAKAAGVTAPTQWSDLSGFLKGLQSAGAVKGLGADVGWDSYNGQDLAQYVWQAGGDLVSADGSAWTLDTPEMIEAIRYNASFFTDGTADTAGPGFLDAQPYFVEGKTAAMFTGPWVIGQFDGVAGTDGWTAANVATAPVPGGASGSIGAVAGGSWGVLANSDNADASWKVIRDLAAPETQVAQFEAIASLPAVQSAWTDPAIASQPLLDAFFTQLQTARNYPQNSTWPQIATHMGTVMEAVAKGAETPEAAASDIQAFAENLGMGE